MQLVALGAKAPQVNALGAFQKGAAFQMQANAVKRQEAQAALKNIGGIALGAMGGKLDGEVDPARFEEGLDILANAGVPVEQFRGKSQLAPMIARGSLDALQQIQVANNDRDYEFALMDFQRKMLDAARGEQPKPLSPVGKLTADRDAGFIPDDVFSDAINKATTRSDGITVSPDGTVTVGGSATFQKETDKNDVKAIQAARDEANVSQELRSLANQMREILPNVGYTGPGGEIYGAIDDAVKVLPGESGSRGAFRQMSMDAQLAMTQKTKGAITDREMAMFKQAVPGLLQTEDGNKAMIAILEAAATRQELRATFLEKYRAQTGSLNGATEAWGNYLEENPLISDEGGSVTVIEPKEAPDEYIPSSGSTPKPQMQGGLPDISSKEQFDALPSGAEFMSGGKRYRKP